MMTSEELAKEVQDFIAAAKDRVVGPGNEQYSYGESQQFEKMNLEDLFQYTYEELQDVAVYATMLQIRLKRLEERLQEERDIAFD